MAAFRAAVALGAPAIELDARRTADGVLVVHHDAVLPDGRVIVETAWRDLPEHVPTFGDALDACDGAWVNIEIKNAPYEPDFDPGDRVAVEVLAHLAERGPGRWLLSSFRLETVDRCHLVAPDVPTAWLTLEIGADTPADLVRRGHTAVHPWEPTSPPMSSPAATTPACSSTAGRATTRLASSSWRRGASTACAPTSPT